MRRFIFVAASLCALVGAGPSLAATKEVRIVKAGFSPVSVTVTAGDTVVWVNRDTVNHQVVSDSGAFVSPTLGPAKSYSFKFGTAGKYTYRDALEPAEKGTVTVNGLPPTVSLGASAPLVPYGGELHIGGVVSTQKPGEQVTVWAQPYGQASYAQLTVVVTTTGGAWDLVVKPAMQTNYQVRAKGGRARPSPSRCARRSRSCPHGAAAGYAKVYGAHSFAGQVAYLQRKTAFGEWVIVRQFTLGPLFGQDLQAASPDDQGDVPGMATGDASAGAGYIESASGTQNVRGHR